MLATREDRYPFYGVTRLEALQAACDWVKKERRAVTEPTLVDLDELERDVVSAESLKERYSGHGNYCVIATAKLRALIAELRAARAEIERLTELKVPTVSGAVDADEFTWVGRAT